MARQRIHNRRASRGAQGGFSWISYSDMMAALLLIFVLILAYSLYHYFSMLETKTKELNNAIALNVAQSEELNAKEQALIIIQTDLDKLQDTLSAKEEELNSTQAVLIVREEELENAKAALLVKQQALDEATANVDPESETELTAAIEELTKEKTIIMIAHRLKTVRNADQIFVIDNGKIAQHGTHDELIRKSGIYRTFVEGRQEAASWKIA